MTPLFSFIIVNYKSADLIPLWFASLPNANLLPNEYEVIIVNNDADETEKLDALKQQYDFKLINTKSNIGFGKAGNLGAKESLGEILGFINPDTQFVAGNLHDIHKQFRSNSSLGIIGARLIAPTGNLQEWSCGTKVTLWDILRNNLGYPKSRRLWESEKSIEVDWVSGAALFLPKTLFQKIHGFDEDFFLYFEDTALCKSARQIGKKVLFFPEIILKHESGASSASSRKQKKYYYASQDLYFAKHRPRWEGWCIKVLRKIFVI